MVKDEVEEKWRKGEKEKGKEEMVKKKVRSMATGKEREREGGMMKDESEENGEREGKRKGKKVWGKKKVRGMARGRGRER